MENFETIYARALTRSPVRVAITQEMDDKIDAFVDAVIQKKQEETEYQLDGGHLRKRFATGFYGELALEALFRRPFVDLSVGTSANYRVSDLSALGYKIGIKSVEHGKFPLVQRNPYQPEIVTVRDGRDVIILGVVPIQTLVTHLDDGFVLDKNALDRKSAFTGLDQTITFASLEDLETITECVDLFRRR